MEERPLPELRGQIILLVRVRNQCVVGGHHGNVQVDKILEERRSVRVGVAIRKLVIPVTLDVPVGVHVAGFVLFDTRCFDLLEAPLRQVDVSSSQVAIKINMLQAESSRERPNVGIVSGSCVANDFDLPVILSVADGGVAIARNFIITLGDWGSN